MEATGPSQSLAEERKLPVFMSPNSKLERSDSVHIAVCVLIQA